MKRLLFGLLGAAVLSATLGSTPALAQTAPGFTPPPAVLPGIPTPVSPTQRSGAGLEGICCGHGARKDWTCVPEQYVKKTTKWVYNSSCEPLCLCYTHGFGLFHKDCGSCESGNCEHPYMRHYLVKKPRVCEECAVKCVPQRAGCHDGCCATDGCVAPVPPAVIVHGTPLGAAPVAPLVLPPQKMPSPK
jgi:hypothetical protein